jgi:hypothetical protein
MAFGRNEEADLWFGSQPPIGNLPPSAASVKLRELGDITTADELAASAEGGVRDAFGVGDDVLGKLFSRYIKTTHLCGFLIEVGERIVSVTDAIPDSSLKSKTLKVTLDGLHVARYPGFGVHRLLFDFAVQAQAPKGQSQVFHYNARFEARDGETVPVRNFPLFYGLKPSAEGVTFGFQTVNVSSGFDEGLLDFLKGDEFKHGLNLATAATPLLAQISQLTASLTRWLASQSKNAKVQEFRQGLDFGTGCFGAGLAAGSYIVVQIPSDYQREWNWNDWIVDHQSLRLAARDNPAQSLDFNHVIFGLHAMTP